MGKDFKEVLSPIIQQMIERCKFDIEQCINSGDPDEIYSCIERTNILLFCAMASAKEIDPDQVNELRCIATVQSDRILWALKDFVNYIGGTEDD